MASTIKKYKVRSIPFKMNNGKIMVITREFIENKIKYYLVCDAETLIIKKVKSSSIKLINKIKKLDFLKTNLGKRLEKYSSSPFPLENDGLIHSEGKVNGYFLTSDMCPSSKKKI
jgi:hypothetical protein